jgi:hypothetical protein
MAAVADLEPGDPGDPDWLAQLVGAAIKITLADGERKTQSMRIK